MNRTVKLIVKGRVQGVGYRYFARERAHMLGITGYVKNLWSGDVEIVAQGDEQIVSGFIDLLREGPSFSMVSDMEITDINSEDHYNKFSVEF